ncbi:MAG: WecB/TagA/CpsF family glycosyltransferase, partial [Lysobacter sp.]
ELLRSDMLLRDGVGIAACLRLLARSPGENANGTDLIARLIDAHAGRRVAVIGTCEPYLQRAREALARKGLDVVCALDGFGEEDRYVPAIVQSRPDLVILGMGMPKQERIAARLAAAADYPMTILNGGAIVDFLAGRFPRAPLWMRQARLEWLYRLAREPRRLWRRYLLGGGLFVSRVLNLGWARDTDASDNPPRIAAAIDTTARDVPAMDPKTPPLFAQTDAKLAQLVQRLDTGLGEGDERIVQFIAARTGEGASALAYSYALASAQLRKRRVLLLSDDLPDGAHPCLVDAIVDPSDGRNSVVAPAGTVGFARLSNPARSHQDNYSALGDRGAWRTLTEGFDEIVVDARAPFALVAAKQATGVIVVVEAEATRASLVRKLLDELAAIDARVLGTILNKHRSYLPYAVHERL